MDKPTPDELEEIVQMLKDSANGMTQAGIDKYKTPFLVGIGHDYRDAEEYGPAGDLSGYIGVCLGYYFTPEDYRVSRLEALTKLTDVEQIRVRSIDPPSFNLLIYVPAVGEYIWGIESDHIRLESLDPRARQVAYAWQAQRTEGRDPLLDAVFKELEAIIKP